MDRIIDPNDAVGILEAVHKAEVIYHGKAKVLQVWHQRRDGERWEFVRDFDEEG